MTRLTLSIKETAQQLGLSKSTIYNLIKSGQLETLKLGRRTLIPLKSVEALIEGGAR